ncbi:MULTISPECIES: ATP-binding protein [unclassified Shewanella]|uniref:ATP-binding protein n=1 Tax=unclassified Shewanella TaxID=196818 RepID=UPI0006D68F4D|nr:MULTISPECIES: ATP-binding protein [unclassified Shewanella]KPZ72871.1 hypothetical protein AN944_00560 [Shewanella sp. P1-14-1]OBT09190.1 hypothetical protein A9267_09310 [Shewanella sp. UCD-FRSSP16_17]
MNSLQMNLNLQLMTPEQIYDEVEAFLIANEITSLQRFKLMLCILEAVNNVSQHCPDNTEDVTLLVQNNKDNIVVDILDTAEFVELSAPKKCPTNDRPNGRGLWIMDQWMDKVNKKATVLGTHLRLSLEKAAI